MSLVAKHSSKDKYIKKWIRNILNALEIPFNENLFGSNIQSNNTNNNDYGGTYTNKVKYIFYNSYQI
jgi:hypothetical protein